MHSSDVLGSDGLKSEERATWVQEGAVGGREGEKRKNNLTTSNSRQRAETLTDSRLQNWRFPRSIFP